MSIHYSITQHKLILGRALHFVVRFEDFSYLFTTINFIMSINGKLEKMEIDYSTTVDKAIPESQQVAKVGF